jgi:hypothetical protein
MLGERVVSTVKILAAFVCGFMLACVPAWPQATTTSNISGTVQDGSGLAVPGAEVRATQTETGLVRTVASSADGTYLLSNLPIGPYQLQVSKAGFSTYVQSGIVLQVNSNPTIEVGLKVGAVSEQVQVEASAVVVETQNTGVGQVIDNQRVVDLPLNGRNPQELVLLSTPSISMGLPINAGRGYPATAISVAGSSSLEILYELDGVDHSQAETNAPLPIPFPDALQEFKLETSSTPARYGHHAGAVVNMVTKSGGNDLHGDLFEFLRNGDVNARNFFAAARDTLKRNQFGGVIGGAVIKNKLFYFGGVQDTILRSDPGTTVITIPTAADQAGDFTVQASPACNAGKQITLAAPYVNNQISPAFLSPIAAKMNSWLPSSAVPTQCGVVTFGFPSASSEKQIVAKVDFQKSEKHSLFARFFTGRYNVQLPIADATKNLLVDTSGSAFNGQNNIADVGVIGDTYLISPTVVSTFRASAGYNPNTGIPAVTAFPKDVGININPISQYPFVGINITGSYSFGTAGLVPYRAPGQAAQVTEDIDMTKGNHQIAFGVNFANLRSAYVSNRLDNGEFQFTGSRTGIGMADFVAGLPATLQQAHGAASYYRANLIGLYVQDTWKATRRLTVNAGVRWEPFLPMHAAPSYPYVEAFSMSNFLGNIKSTVYPNMPAGMIFPGDKAWTNEGLAFAARDWKQFAPRAGLVFDPRGQGKEVIRAGYGIFFDVPGLGFATQTSNSQPFGGAVLLTNPNFANPYGTYPGGNPFPFTLGPNVQGQPYGVYNLYNIGNPTVYVQQWNLSVQRQFGSDWSVTLAYVGNKTTHQWIENELNPAVYIPGASCVINGTSYNPCSSTGNTDQRRILSLMNFSQGQYYSAMQTTYAAGNANYNAGIATIQKRFNKNVSALVLYTWSHCLSIAEPGGLNNHYDGQDPYNFESSYGNCTQDVRQLFSGSFAFASPKFSNRLVQKIAGNWQLSPIIRANTGLPINPLSGKDNALNGTLGSNSTTGIQRPNYICDPNSGFTQSLSAYYNNACIVQNGVGQLGNAGKNSLRAPGAIIVNVSLSRRFAIREKQSLDIRAEAYNLPNTANFGAPGNNLASSTFGKITSTLVSGGATSGQTGDPRILQVGIKYAF